MARRVPLSERPELFRQPDDWARDWGWVSPRRAANDAAALRNLASTLRDSLNDEGGEMWAKECERIAKRIDPAINSAKYRARKRRERSAAQRER